MIDVSDAEVILESLGDPGRFGEIFDRHAQAIYRFLGRRVGADDGGDLLSEVFLAAFESRQRYDTRVPMALPWLYGIASNLLSKHFRKRAGELRAMERVVRPTHLDGTDDAVVASVDAQLHVRAVAHLLAKLTAAEREVLLLHAWEELTYEELAVALGIPVGTVRSRLNRTRRKLRVGLDEIDSVRAARPDRLSPIADPSSAVLHREKEKLMQVLTEGKTKVIEDAGNGEVLIRSKDDITTGDGTQHDVLDGKAAASTRTTSNVFRLLERNGVRTHFVERVDDVTFRARNVEMLPLELVARRYATGSFRDRFPELAEGAVLEELVFEIFEKDDTAHDPLLEFDFAAGVVRRCVPNNKAAEVIGPDVKAGDLLGEQPLRESRYAHVSPELLAQLRDLTVTAFGVIEDAWKQQGGVYIDFKIECGFDRETGELLVADVIDSDSGRLRFGEVDMSKQSYRDGTATLPEIKKKFDEVAALTERFA
ncbi:MAG TPA: phosphoribosylaminoimidazolesuccinocarboxamide synthase [Acidimicrobiales bacterium]|nr:phosphoribosylaminoimidazolesuccinocarboxamide synthase [Acidimicrobiales bacterium]